MAEFEQLGNRSAARIVARMPANDGVLDPDAVDATLLRCHAELQRLEEEFAQGHRLMRVLGPLLATLETSRPRIVDIGCGAGFVIRWLAAHAELDAELIGCDLNPALVGEARRLAALESLPCRFVHGSAFSLDEPADVYLSTGVVHHFRGDDLVRFFAQQATAPAFIHFDIQPSWLAPLGAWVFHVARMREPLARHDGTLSALRAYTSAQLVSAIRAGCPDHQPCLFDEHNALLPIFRVLRPIIGLPPARLPTFQDALGPHAHRLVVS